MFLKCSVRRKDGKEHRSWSIVESRRVHGGGSVQRHLLYLGEINDSQQAAWQKSIAVLAEGDAEPRQYALFPEDRVGAASEVPQLQLKVGELTLHRPRQWGACWLGLELWRELRLDQFTYMIGASHTAGGDSRFCQTTASAPTRCTMRW